jgi:hypothetical protein
VDDETQRRIARNEAAFRKVNEALRASKPLADATRLFCFRCECGVLGCNKLLELTLPEYEAVRAWPTRFAVVHGHDIPGTERLVEHQERFDVVEKDGDGAKAAVDTDPRA